VTGTTIGFAFDAGSGSKELGAVFATAYAIGCLAAVLAVRQSGIFTAVIQPPLILFVTVPGSYFLFHGAKFTGIKDLLINCGYPLIERFPLMLFTSAGVLLIGMARWYFATSSRVRAGSAPRDSAVTATPSRFAALAARLGSLFAGGEAGEHPERKHGIDRPARAEKRPRSGRPAKRPAPTRSRHARPPLDDITEAPRERPRRQPTKRRPASAVDYDAPEHPADAPRRRPRSPREPGLRTPPPSRHEPRERRDPYGPGPRPSRSSRFEPYPPYEPPPRPRPAPESMNGFDSGSGTHHPVSRVRYRGSGADDEENRRDYRGRPRRSPDRGSEAWRYDD